MVALRDSWLQAALRRVRAVCRRKTPTMVSTEDTGLSSGSTVRSARGSDPGLLPIALLVLVGGCAALTVDVARTGYGVKGDEATYVAMALSVAFDGDLEYDSRDIYRLHQVYQGGPQGIFLKRGAGAHDRDDRLYFGKAYMYSVLAAPFVRLAGLNGILLLHVLLLGGMVLAGYVFLSARSPRRVAMLSTAAFFGMSIMPLYAVFLAPEIFNSACVMFAYFLWLYKEVAPQPRNRWQVWLGSAGTDAAAAVLLAVATFSKPSHVLLILPLLMVAVWRQRFRRSALVAISFAFVVTGSFAVNAAITGEANYQGGVRKTFYGTFPFEGPGVTFDNAGYPIATDAVDKEHLRIGFSSLLPTNLQYFLMGRHFGFVPFYFPGVVAIALFLWARNRLSWQWATLGIAAVSAVAMIGGMPYTWSGGGGPPGNRYFLSIYPILLFVTPPLVSIIPAVVAWMGGALFIAHILGNPFVAAKRPYLNTETGMLRALPVELTMVDDLPIALSGRRHRIVYASDPALLLSLLDRNVDRSGDMAFWVAGRSRTDIVVRSDQCLSTLTVALRSPIANRVTVSVGGHAETVQILPGNEERVMLKPNGLYVRGRWGYMLSIRTRGGFVPSFQAPGLRDDRFLGTQFSLVPHVDHACTK